MTMKTPSDAAFWQGRSVFVTGHTGFKGGWLTLWLQAMGAEVTGFSLPPPTDPSLFELARIGSGIRSHCGDVRDLPALRQAMETARPEVVFHLAAQPLVRASYHDPVGTYGTNVLGTVHLLEAVRHVPSVRSVVIISSDKCYENKEWCWPYNETHTLGGHDPYSNSKACAELVVDAFRNSYFPPDRHAGHGVAIATARAGNVIGGGDWSADRLVPDVFRALREGRPVVLRNPTATRPWQHVLEPLSGYLLLAEGLHTQGTRFSGAWNFGPSDYANRTVCWVVETLCTLWGDSATWLCTDEHRLHEAQLLQVDSSKARSALGWAPRLDPRTALVWTTDWIRAWAEQGDLRQVCLDQIDAFAASPAYDPLAADARSFTRPATSVSAPLCTNSVPA